MLNLILTILCSTSIALILKYNDVKRGTSIVLLAGNYLIAAGISLFVILIEDRVSFSIETFVFGAVLGIFFVVGFFAFAKSVSIAGTALSTVSARLSVVIPILLSIIIFKEIPSLYHDLGFLFTLITIGLFYFSLRSHKQEGIHFKEYSYLFALMLLIGINDFSMKVFQDWRLSDEKPFFLFTIFLFAFIYSMGFIIFRRISFEKTTFSRGMVLGVPNMFSTFFLLGALAELPGIIVYPLTNVGIIFLTSIAAALIWKEFPNKAGIWALVFGCVAIVLLSL